MEAFVRRRSPLPGFVGSLGLVPRSRRRRSTAMCAARAENARPALPASVAVLRHGATGSKVYVVGVLHGSHIAVDDIIATFEDAMPVDTVMLELCEERGETVKRQFAAGIRRPVPLLPRYLAAVVASRGRKLVEDWGSLGQGAVALWLNTVSSLSWATGLIPGVEFYVAHRLAKSSNARVVYGDDGYMDTISGLSDAFNPFDALLLFPVRTWKTIRQRFDLDFKRLAGIEKKPPPVAVLFLSEPRRLVEYLRISAPILVAFSAVPFVLHQGARWVTSAAGVSSTPDPASVADWVSLAGTVFSCAVTIVVCAITAGISDTMVSRRNETLVRSLRAICDNRGGERITVVAVCGAAHVRGMLHAWSREEQVCSAPDGKMLEL